MNNQIDESFIFRDSVNFFTKQLEIKIENKLKTIRIINGNHKDKFKEKHIVKEIFRKKWCDKGDVTLSLDITNSIPKYLEPVLIWGFLVSLKY